MVEEVCSRVAVWTTVPPGTCDGAALLPGAGAGRSLPAVLLPPCALTVFSVRLLTVAEALPDTFVFCVEASVSSAVLMLIPLPFPAGEGETGACSETGLISELPRLSGMLCGAGAPVDSAAPVELCPGVTAPEADTTLPEGADALMVTPGSALPAFGAIVEV